MGDHYWGENIAEGGHRCNGKSNKKGWLDQTAYGQHRTITDGEKKYTFVIMMTDKDEIS